MKPSYIKYSNKMDTSSWYELAKILSTYTNDKNIYKLFKFLFTYSFSVIDEKNKEGRILIDHRALVSSLILYPLQYRIFLSYLISKIEEKEYKRYSSYYHLLNKMVYKKWNLLDIINITCQIRGERLNKRYKIILSEEGDEISRESLDFLLNSLRLKPEVKNYIFSESYNIDTFSFFIKKIGCIMPIFSVINEKDFFSLLNNNNRGKAIEILLISLNLNKKLYNKLILFNKKVIKKVYIKNIYV